MRKATSLILLVSLCLCFFSTPALADNPWTEDPPRKHGGGSGARNDFDPDGKREQADVVLDLSSVSIDISVRVALMIEQVCGPSAAEISQSETHISDCMLGMGRCNPGQEGTR
jgi:hypothetical protein